jgi:hypothetical protein
MKKSLPLISILTFLVLLVFNINSNAQRVLIDEDFEDAGLGGDSLPTDWFQIDMDNSGQPGVVWAVRDTGTTYPGANPEVVVAKAHDGARSLTIAWTAGNPVADDWAITIPLNILQGDSLIFWMLLGSIEGISPYLDTMQVHVLNGPDPAFSIQKLATIKSNDSAGVPLSNNEWTQHKFDLSAFAGQEIYLAFRYFMNTSLDGLWCNIDDVFVGNRKDVGITQIGLSVPDRFALSQNYPNPFNPVTKIKFDIARNSSVRLTIFNSLGQVVEEIFNGQKPAGYYEAEFDASALSSGTYYYRLETDNFVETKKMMLIK